jgi:3',5'-cyclic-nucleotide phosphodiesterase
MFILALLPFFLITVDTKSISTNSKRSSFYIIPLGITGGLYENNLSSYLLTTVSDNTPDSTYISLDSGTIRYGLE